MISISTEDGNYHLLGYHRYVLYVYVYVPEQTTDHDILIPAFLLFR
jgi:hypothetical protein